MAKRTYDDSLRTDFFVIVEEDRGRWSLCRLDNVNWNIGGITAGPSFNGSGPDHGPDVLVSKEQAAAYAQHVADLWNADVRRQKGADLMAPTSQYAVMLGNIASGYTVYGPFEEYNDALAFAEDSNSDWHIVTLHRPEPTNG